MTDWRHDEWCATFLDGAPEEECDCVRATLIRLEAGITQLEEFIAAVLTSCRAADVLAFVHGMKPDYSKTQAMWLALPEDMRMCIETFQEQEDE